MHTFIVAAVSALALAVSAAAHADQSSQGSGGWQYNPERNPSDSGFGVWSRIDGMIVPNTVGRRSGQQDDTGDTRSGQPPTKG